MTTTYQEAVDSLLSGQELEWVSHGSYSAGKIVLASPEARRLLDCLTKQSPDVVLKGDESIFPDLIEAWENEGNDPKDEIQEIESAEGVDGFRLATIETEGFGGINLFGEHPFVLDVDRKSWCLEGQNGSGKTSLVSAIIWGLTGRRVREHLGPVADNGDREPVFDTDGKKIGTWPPLATYPPRAEDIGEDARVLVKLTFRNKTGDEAIVERIILSKADGNIEIGKQDVDPRLLSAPQLIESGILMPSRMKYINFGDRSQSLYEAVKALTGLDQLGAIGDGAAALTHGARKFLKYAKDQGLAQIGATYERQVSVAIEKSKTIEIDLSDIVKINKADITESLEKLIDKMSKSAGEFAKTLDSVVSNNIDLSQHQGRKVVSDAVGVAREVAKRASEKVKAFSILKELFDAKQTGYLDAFPELIAQAERDLESAISWHIRQQDDLKLRLKALASQWYLEPETPEDLANCPLCQSALQSPEQKQLQKELKDLKDAGDKAEKRLNDVCREIRENLIAHLPQGLRHQLDALGQMEPKRDIMDGATQLFTNTPPFSDTLTGVCEIMKSVIPAKGFTLPAFEPSSQLRVEDNDPTSATSVRELLFNLQYSLELADWWKAHRPAFGVFWKSIVGIVPDGEELDAETVLGQISIVEDALAASQPYDEILNILNELLNLAKSWSTINSEQKKREDIARALTPLKDLRAFVDSETARSILNLSERMKELLSKIHYKERLDFQDAGLKKKEVHVHGAFTEGIKFDALPIANTSWLKAILWAFIFALREKSIETYGGNPFPLILLDDPQVTFDPRNKRKWAQELARISGLDEADEAASQIFLTTYERQFFTLLSELEGMEGQTGLIAQADEFSGCLTIVNGSVIERAYCAIENDDAKARTYIRQVRIYIEKLMKYMLRGEGHHIAGANLDSMRRELSRLKQSHTAPFNRKPFEKFLGVINGGERAISLINNPPHDDDETMGVAEADDVHSYWISAIWKRIQNAFEAYAAFEAYHGEPRSFVYPANVVALPTGQDVEVRNAQLFQTGLAAAAATDGRVGDGVLRIEEWEQPAERVVLHNHEVYRLTANTLDPVASAGDMIIVSNYAQIEEKQLVVAAVGDKLLARRLQISDVHPDLAILTAQAVNPFEIEVPYIAPLEGLDLKKIVGSLFASNAVGAGVSSNELEEIVGSHEYLPILNNARLFRVQGRSAEPIALDGQYLMVDNPISDQSRWDEYEGRLVIGIDSNNGSYFKRFRSPRAGLYVMESLNPDGTTPAELLSSDASSSIPQLTHIFPVVGVLYELPD